MEDWSVSDLKNSEYIGVIEFQDITEEWHVFEIMRTTTRLVFGGSCNVGFLESGYIAIDHTFSIDENLQYLVECLEEFYNTGDPTELIHNERM